MFRNRYWTSSWIAQCQTIVVALVVLLAMSGILSIFTVHAKSPAAGPSEQIALSQLPVQGQAMMTLIYQGGPFKYDKDGTVFGNREHFLPERQRGYYREYTVKMPGERNRGVRRIVCGGDRPAAPDACFYTDDHYASYRQIVR